MNWLYIIRTGELLRPNGSLAGIGYSGKAEAKNDPSKVAIKDVGPLPPGFYKICPAIPDWDGKGQPPKHPTMGAWPVIPLEPQIGNDMHGRSGFFVHGTNLTNDASHGCIIMGPLIRRELNNAVHQELVVQVEPINAAKVSG